MTTDYGTDFSWTDDLDAAFRLVSGPERVGQAIYRRLTTKRGSVIDAPDYGFDLRELLSLGLTDGDVGALAGLVRQEVVKDECVRSATVTTSLVDEALRVDLVAELADGPLRLVLSVTEAGVATLKEGV